MHQPPGQVLTRALLPALVGSVALVGIAACAPPEAPPAAPRPDPLSYRLAGSAPCGPRCTEERWEADQELLLVQIRPRTVRGAARWMRSWPALRGPLGACLGDPLATPPAADAQGHRELILADGHAWWWLSLSGDNRCALSGELALAVDRDRAQTEALLVAGRPWLDGGREAAERALRAEARAWTPAEWAAMDPEARAWLEHALDRPLGPPAPPPSGPDEGAE